MTEPEAFRDIDLQVTGGIATISFARPRFLNAASENLLREMLTTLYSLEHRDDVGVIVVRGTGPAFSSGFGLAEIPIEQDGSRGITRTSGSRRSTTTP